MDPPAEIDAGNEPASPPTNQQELQARRRTRLLEQENEVLRRAAAYLSQPAVKRLYPLVEAARQDAVAVCARS